MEDAVLDTEPKITSPDDFHEALIETHRGLPPKGSALLHAKLILVLANRVGHLGMLREVMARARVGVSPAGEDATLEAVA